MPNQHKAGKVQFNAWLDADVAAAIKSVMKKRKLKYKSEAIHMLLREALSETEQYGSKGKQNEERKDKNQRDDGSRSLLHH